LDYNIFDIIRCFIKSDTMRLIKTLTDINEETGTKYTADIWDEFIAIFSQRKNSFKSLFIFNDNLILVARRKRSYNLFKGSKNIYKRVKSELLETKQVEFIFKTFYVIYTMKIRGENE